MTSKYKWNSPQDWLLANLGKFSKQELYSLIVSCCCGDDIQDHFQSEMNKDGYFTPINLEDCGVLVATNLGDSRLICSKRKYALVAIKTPLGYYILHSSNGKVQRQAAEKGQTYAK